MIYIKMIKGQEDGEFVWYECTLVDSSVDDANRVETRQPTAILKFNKIGVFNDQSLFFIPEESDSLFLSNERLFIACGTKMFECKRENNYPNSLIYVSCGSY